MLGLNLVLISGVLGSPSLCRKFTELEVTVSNYRHTGRASVLVDDGALACEDEAAASRDLTPLVRVLCGPIDVRVDSVRVADRVEFIVDVADACRQRLRELKLHVLRTGESGRVASAVHVASST